MDNGYTEGKYADSRSLPVAKRGQTGPTAVRASSLSLVPATVKRLQAPIACLPVLASTQLYFGLLLHGPVFDLAAVADVIGRDPCAVLRLFALVADEFPDPANRPQRLEDCLAGVDRAALWQALAEPPSCREEQQRAIPFAGDSFTSAHYARTVALSLGLAGDQAFLLGLLHAIGSLPAVLGRTKPVRRAEALAEEAAKIAAAYHLPPSLCRALVAVHRQEPGSVWVAVLAAAYDLAAKAGFCLQLKEGSATVFPPEKAWPAPEDWDAHGDLS